MIATAVGGALLAAALVAPPMPVLTADQVANARAVVAAATALHLGGTAAALGVTAALGESGLRDLDHGDGAVNPDGTPSDSLGLFQQQHWWGTVAERMDPTDAATAFYRHLEQVPGWRAMTPSAAIHAVQGNADPGFYAPFYPEGAAIAVALEAHPAPARTPASAAAPSYDFGSASAAIDRQLLAALAAGGAAEG